MLAAARDAMDFARDVTFQELLEDRQKQYAIVRAVEIIGEAARNIPQPVRRRFPDVPWVDIVATRNKVIHEYFGVNLEVVWATVRRDLPALVPALERMIAEVEREERGG